MSPSSWPKRPVNSRFNPRARAASLPAMSRHFLSALVCSLSIACGGTPPPAEQPASSAADTSSEAADMPSPAAEAPADKAEASEPAAKPAETQPAASDTAPREVKYIQTPEGLKVEVSGLRFHVKVASSKVG